MNVPVLKYLKSLPKDKLQRVVLVGVGTLIGLVVACHFYVVKQISSIGDSRQKIADLKQQIDESEVAERQAAKNEPARQELLAFVDGQRALMVTGDPFSWVVRELTLVAEQHPVRVLGLHPGGVTPHSRTKNFSTYLMSIELESSYDEIGVFVRDLENKFPTAEVRSVEVSGESDARQKLHVVVKLALLVRPQPAGGKAGSPTKPGAKSA